MSGQAVIKTPIGSFVPEGWSILKTTRSGQYIQKKAAAPVPKDEMDGLLSAFKTFGIAATAVTAADVEMEGGRHRRRSHTKRHARKTRKTRRHRA